MKWFSTFAVLALLLVAAGEAYPQTAGVPQTISFQGKLTDTSGNPITTGVDVRFRIYNVATMGTHLWEETHASVTPDSNGLYNVLLGTLSTLSLTFDEIYYLEVSVSAAGAGTYETLSPRYEMSSSPYSFMTKALEGLATTVSELNQLAGVNPSVSSTNLNTLTGGVGSNADALHEHTLAAGATDVTASASELNQALHTISASVTAANLGILTGGSASNADALHIHTLAGLSDISAVTGAELDQLSGILTSVSAANLNILTGTGNADALHVHTLAAGATDVTATAANINQALTGISPNVTAANLGTLTGTGNADALHVHTLAMGATDVTATALEINTALSGISPNVTAANLGILTGGVTSDASALHNHWGASWTGGTAGYAFQIAHTGTVSGDHGLGVTVSGDNRAGFFQNRNDTGGGTVYALYVDSGHAGDAGLYVNGTTNLVGAVTIGSTGSPVSMTVNGTTGASGDVLTLNASLNPAWASAASHTHDASHIVTGTLASARLAGQYTGITGLGTITVGSWNASPIGAQYGGTGIDTSSATGVPSVNVGTWSVAAQLSSGLGGTGTGTYAVGDILYASAINTLGKLAVGANGHVLTLSAGAPSWAAANAHTHDATHIVTGTLASARISGSYTGITGVGTLTAGTWNATTIGEGYGGTGQTTYAAGDLLYASAINTLGKLAAGTNGHVLTLSAGAPSWAAANAHTHDATHIVTGTLASARISGSYTGITGVGTLTAGTWNATTIGEGYGGTGQTTYAAGDLLYASAINTLGKLAAGTNGHVLTLSAGAPSWAAANAHTHDATHIVTGTLASARISGSYTGITGVGTLTAGTWNATTIGEGYGGTGQTTYAAGDLLYASAINTLGNLAAGTNGHVLTLSAGAPSWAAANAHTHDAGTDIVSGILPSARISGSYTGITGVGTLTAGTWNATTIGEGYGGTGQTTYAAGDLLYASAINTLGKLAAGTNGHVLTLSAGAPSWAAANAHTHDAGTDIVSGILPSARISGSYTGITGVGTLTAGTWNATTIGEGYGGTGQTTYAVGDLLYGSALNTLGKLAAGSDGQVLTLSLGAPSWAAANAHTHDAGTDIVSGTLASARISGSYTGITGVGTLTAGTWNATTIGEGYGGTGQTTYAAGDLLYASAINTLGKLAAGTNGHVLTLSAGAPSWAAANAHTHDAGTDIVSGILPSARISGSYTGITGVGTLTAGTWNATTIGEGYGGTGQTTYAVGDLLYASAINTLGKLAAGTNGHVLTLSAGAPSWAAANAHTHDAGTDIVSGTLADARLSTNVTLQGNTFNGVSQLVQLNAAGALPAVSGANLTNLSATAIATGTLTDARLTANVTIQGNAFNGANQLVQLNGFGALPAVSGVNLTNLNASAISSGTLGAARGGTGIDSTGQTGVAVVSAGNWNIAAQIAPAAGGTGMNTSGSTGVPFIAAGSWAVDPNQLNPQRGGTGIGSYVSGDIIYATGGSSLARLGVGSNGHVLTVSTGAPSWAAANAHTHTAADIVSGTLNDARLSSNVMLLNNAQTVTGMKTFNPPTLGTAPFSIGGNATNILVTGLNADRLDGQHGSYYRSATNINAGTLSTSYYSAYSDLSAEGYLGDASGDIARNNGNVQTNLNADMVDGQHASAFSVTTHNHFGQTWTGSTTYGLNVVNTNTNGHGLRGENSGGAGYAALLGYANNAAAYAGHFSKSTGGTQYAVMIHAGASTDPAFTTIGYSYMNGRLGIGTSATTTELLAVGTGGDVDFDSGTFFVDASFNRVGINDITPSYPLDVTGDIRSTGRLRSTVATGTPPITVSSTTMCANLNADMVDGVHASGFATSGHNHYGESWTPASSSTYGLRITHPGYAGTCYGLRMNVRRITSVANAYGVYGYIYGNSINDISSSYAGYFGMDSAVANGTRYGVFAFAVGNGTMSTAYDTMGINAYSSNAYGEGFGGRFRAYRSGGNASTRDLYGVYGSASLPTGAGATANVYGGYFAAYTIGGHTSSTYGVYAYHDGAAATWEYALRSVISGGGNYAGYFSGNTHVQGTFTASTNKGFVQPHPTDPKKELFYICAEGPEPGIFERGTARLIDGEAVIEMPEHFRLAAFEDRIDVLLTPRSADSKGLAAVEVRRERIVVRELMGGKGNYDFSYYVSAVRAGYENHKPIQENVHFLPANFPSIEELEKFYAQDHASAERKLMISNGILNPDGTLNRAKCLSLGFRLPPEKEDRDLKTAPREDGPDNE